MSMDDQGESKEEDDKDKKDDAKKERRLAKIKSRRNNKLTLNHHKIEEAHQKALQVA